MSTATVTGPGPAEMRALSARLKAAGTEGKGLRRNMYQAMNDAVQPLAAEISNVEHLKSYMPDPYAVVLAGDLGVRVAKNFGANPRIEVRAQARRRRRKIERLNEGFISHPVWPRGPRAGWRWSVQRAGMRRGFFSDPVSDASPEIKDKILQAMTETARQVTGKA